MEEEITQSQSQSQSPPPKQEVEQQPAPQVVKDEGGGGWGGWGLPRFAVLSDLQKAAEEISRNAIEAARNAAKSIEEMQNTVVDSESPKEKEDTEESEPAENPNNDDDTLWKSTLVKLENASEDSLLGQGLKVLDSSVENFASGAWQALGSAWKGGSTLVQKLESSAVNIAESIQHGNVPAPAGSVAPSLLETGKAFTAKGMQVLERVGKETMDLLINETGIEVDKNPTDGEQQNEEEQLFEEVTFDRCFYIYGGPEHLEELEALSNHYALLFNRRKAKLSSEQKSFYDAKLKQVQQIFSLSSETDETDSDKGKKIETVEDGSGDEMKILRDSSVSKAADMAAGFTTILTGLAGTEIVQKTAGRLESIHSEGVHRLSELCCFAVSQLLTLGKSIISNASKAQTEEEEQDIVIVDWPEDSIAKAKVIRLKAQLMAGDVEAVSNSFIMGISDVVGAYQAAIRDVNADNSGGARQTSIQDKANAISDNLQKDHTSAMDKIQDGLQYLAFVVLSTSMPSA
ncbi:Bat2 domain protein [Thalictrum thalictroides]|uniref:Bat2 domain protein n=1 Tax=Thalictrum thalictroides TaxID=46969 RepID=A0A7J6W259_THATH|nr:Bat2 domain protein [Thalictrum thalictroides]